MGAALSQKLIDILVCSSCMGGMSVTSEGAYCDSCNVRYTYSKSGILDLRLKNSKTYDLRFTINDKDLSGDDFCVSPILPNPEPEVDFSGISTPLHLTDEILSFFPRAGSRQSMMLDLGCGNGVHRSVVDHAGFEWVGLDYSSEKSTLLGDAHSLPFKAESFEFLLSIAVIEHIRYPFLMIKEAWRVLKKGSLFIGTVAFLEPFHGNSFYHHTHLGIGNLLKYGGFEIVQLSPNRDWPALKAQANMALFPKMPKNVSNAIVYPVNLLSDFWWKLGGLMSKKARLDTKAINTAGSFIFIARK